MKNLCVLLYLFSNLCSLQGFVCPGGNGECKVGMTCCELPNGSQGCCPFQDATCCRDKIHCCPYGLQCHKNGCGRRLEGITYVPLTQIGIVENVICPDNKQCPDGQTCCSISSDSYGCCPMLDAVCCSDKEHCCPPGTYCDAHGYCYRAEESLKNYSSSIVCPGDKFICPAGNTCCSLSDDEWGCCPIENAVCCSDGLYCCPGGYTCSDTGCIQDMKQIPVSKFIKIRKAL